MFAILTEWGCSVNEFEFGTISREKGGELPRMVLTATEEWNFQRPHAANADNKAKLLTGVKREYPPAPEAICAVWNPHLRQHLV